MLYNESFILFYKNSTFQCLTLEDNYRPCHINASLNSENCQITMQKLNGSTVDHRSPRGDVRIILLLYISQGCRGFLCDSIINFRDNLEDDIFTTAAEHSQESNLMLCLGTTMTVTPANELVEMGQQPQRLVICNRYMSKSSWSSGITVGAAQT